MTELPIQEIKKRCDQLASEFLNNHQAMTAVEAIKDLHMFGAGPHGSRGRVLVGHTRCGKSRLVNQYTNEFLQTADLTPFEDDGMKVTPMPILSIEAAASGGVAGLVETALAKLEDLRPTQGPVVQKTYRLHRRLKQRRVSLIIVDEAHHLIDRTRVSPKLIKEIAEWIKALLNNSPAPILLCGVPSLVALPDAVDQLRARCRQHIEMKEFPFTTAEEQKEFRLLLKKFEIKLKELGVTVSPGLSSQAMSAMIHAATYGRIGIISELLTMTLKAALKRGLSNIDQELLGDQFAEYNPFQDGRNPLRQKIAA